MTTAATTEETTAGAKSPIEKLPRTIWAANKAPAMGAFNEWTKGTFLEQPENRHVVDVNKQLLTGAAYQYRLQALKLTGVDLAEVQGQYVPSVPQEDKR